MPVVLIIADLCIIICMIYCTTHYYQLNNFLAITNYHKYYITRIIIPYIGQESESAEIGFLWGPKHEQFSNASLSALNLKKHFET